MRRTNWAGNYTYRARRLHRPSTLEQLREICAAAPELKALGSAHSFTDIGDCAELVTLDALEPELSFDHAAGCVSLTANQTYGAVAQALTAERMALANLASLPHISVAGAVSTGTHGSGDGNGSLSAAVRELELVTSTGEVICARRGQPEFDGMVVGLGALGVLTRLTLDVEPAYEMRQRVFEGLSWEALVEHFDAITGSGYSVSLFTRWGASIEQAWVKSRVSEETETLGERLFGATAAGGERHPIPGLDPANCTSQLGAAGPWWDRLPHFRMGFTPSSGAEIQSEYLLPRRHAVAAIDAMRGLGEVIGPVLQVSEIRTIAADRLWMSPAYGRDSVALHFTWSPQQQPVERALAAVEEALMPLQGRPHWGKLFLAEPETIAAGYDRCHSFIALAAQLDPRGAFRNRWLERHLPEV
ncbi:MAG: FAD-binding protein [Solirubrobacterales bacterium]|nr:FAD-binding protein [Solirubrobacterales bacterium]